ncbi:nucleotidyltransferase [Aliidongia dinghuensis]|uniref:DNA-directed DNA polymerase n=1 Tax=Aliidongia dinghuensis TaxID=1867774 RepID=A0A8J2YT82_9PROT|nr:DNA polymerase Y family protein [Aliidongia dinghuensis]GGF18070.1 nucleotidyltransferase [Aliidongia dinghuensis]
MAAVNGAAQAEGLRPGLTVAHAQMLVPEFTVIDADPTADLAGLTRLAVWCQQHYAPLTSPDPPDGLWIDATGCTHLWRDERAMLTDLRQRLWQAGISARVAIADTPAAAHAMARFQLEAECVVPAGEGAAICLGLPVAALRLSADTVAGLRRLGFDTIGALMRAPRAQMALRFGDEPVRRLDQLTGRLFEPIDPILAPERLRRRASFVEPISTAPAIETAIDHLVRQLADDLRRRGLGACALDLVVERVDGVRQAHRVGLAQPSRDASHLRKLLVMRIEKIDPGFGIDAISLAVAMQAPLSAALSASLVDRELAGRDLAPLIDSLGNRFGEDRLFRAALVESDVPERSWRAIPSLSRPTGVSWPADLPRPARLLTPPELVETTALLPDYPPAFFVWRHDRHKTIRVDGPERIHGEWWRSDREIETVRDYFRIEDEAGQRFWLFRSGISNDARWFLHGLFG